VRSGQAQQLTILSLGVLMAGNFVLQYPLGWIADHTNRRRAAIVTAVVIVIGAIVCPLMLPDLRPTFWLMMFIRGDASWGCMRDRLRGGKAAQPGK
jgi:MFS family permease